MSLGLLVASPFTKIASWRSAIRRRRESFELVYANSSLAEKLQEALPDAKVVKTMKTD
jgi:hypothetical protein